MKSKCPPGVFCVENYTLGILGLIIVGVLLYLWKGSQGNSSTNSTNSTNYMNDLASSINNLVSTINTGSQYTRPDSVWTSGESVLLNPYMPPERDERPFLGRTGLMERRSARSGIPINVRTQGVESDYRQVGILTRINGQEMILPLMGRPLIAGRDTWNFYTMSDNNSMVKLPITFKNKNCSGEYGCDNISNGDTVYVEGYNDAFKVTMYENNTMRYIPYI